MKMVDLPHQGETVEVPQVVKMPVSDMDFGTITITENWGRLFIKHRDGTEIVVSHTAYRDLVDAISRFIPSSPEGPTHD
jgi:hypothetical protein